MTGFVLPDSVACALACLSLSSSRTFAGISHPLTQVAPMPTSNPQFAYFGGNKTYMHAIKQPPQIRVPRPRQTARLPALPQGRIPTAHAVGTNLVNYLPSPAIPISPVPQKKKKTARKINMPVSSMHSQRTSVQH